MPNRKQEFLVIGIDLLRYLQNNAAYYLHDEDAVDMIVRRHLRTLPGGEKSVVCLAADD